MEKGNGKGYSTRHFLRPKNNIIPEMNIDFALLLHI